MLLPQVHAHCALCLLCAAGSGVRVLSDKEVADKLIVVTQTRRSAKLDDGVAKLIHDGLSAYEAELHDGRKSSSRPQQRPPRAPSRWEGQGVRWSCWRPSFRTSSCMGSSALWGGHNACAHWQLLRLIHLSSHTSTDYACHPLFLLAAGIAEQGSTHHPCPRAYTAGSKAKGVWFY